MWSLQLFCVFVMFLKNPMIRSNNNNIVRNVVKEATITRVRRGPSSRGAKRERRPQDKSVAKPQSSLGSARRWLVLPTSAES